MEENFQSLKTNNFEYMYATRAHNTSFEGSGILLLANTQEWSKKAALEYVMLFWKAPISLRNNAFVQFVY